MNLLWMSNAPWAGTGYGQQTRILLNVLKQIYTVNCFPFWGLDGGRIQYDGYTCWPPAPFNQWGNDVIQAHIDHSKSDVLVTLMDLFVLDKKVWNKLEIPWVAWVPIDSVGIGPDTMSLLEICPYPVAMSHFGAQQMAEAGVEPADVIYHAVDTDLFRPLDPLEKSEAREELDFDPDCFLIGMVMANKGDRKQFPVQLKAIRQWMDSRPDLNVKVYLHTCVTSKMQGWDIKQLVKQIGLSGHVYAVNEYVATTVPAEPDLMARIFGTFDVLMNCSAGEGFGIPIAEAQSCGVPVITHDITAMSEITKYGYAVKSGAWGLAGHYGWQAAPDLEDIVYRLESVYRMANKADSMNGRNWIIENCSVPVIVGKWVDLLNRVIEERELKIRSNREMVP